MVKHMAYEAQISPIFHRERDDHWLNRFKKPSSLTSERNEQWGMDFLRQ